jgi:hypothetical protein
MPGLQALLALTTAVLAVRAAAQRVPARFLDDLAPAPRLLLPEARLDALRARHEADPVLRGYVEQVLAAAATEAGREPLRYQKRGIRLLAVSRDALQRIQHLAFAYRWTGERRFLDAGRGVLRAACAFPDWNPSHFLDTAELSHAVGLGYDWLRADLDPGEAAAIRDGLIRLGLRPGIAELDKDAWWAESAFNWNNVCFGGLVVGALAVADTDPEWAARLVPATVQGLPKAIASYDPDGAWMEGPAYWAYATRYTVWGLEAMRSALGTDFGLSDTPGLRAAGHFPIHGAGPTGRYFNYADSGTDAGRGPLPSLFWLAGRFDDAFLAEAEHALLRGGARPAPAHLWFYRPPGGAATAAALDRRFDGRVPVVTMRSAWDDPAALYLAVKGGDNTVNHGQLDCGSFVFDALGQRWAHDLGADDYDLPGYFDKRDGGRRWRYYRNRAASHNVPLLGDEAGRDVEQRVAGTAGVIAHASRPREASCVLDLSEVYGAPVERLRRGVQLRDGRSRVLVQDEWRLAEPRPLAFGLTTRAEVELGDGRRATLRLGGRALRAEVLEPERASFVVEDCPTGAGERSNAGFRRLLLRVPAGRRSVRIAVLLTPVVDGAEAGGLPRIEPLAHW